MDKKKYYFTYSTNIELLLLSAIMQFFVPHAFKDTRRRNHDESGKRCKQVETLLKYLDWVTVESAYEYFRRHIKKEFTKATHVELAKCRKAKTKNKRRKELEEAFFTDYIIKSNLYRPEDLIEFTIAGKKEMQDRYRMATTVQGGNFKSQLNTNLLLGN